MRRIALAAAVVLAAVTNLWAQTGQLPAWNVLGNPSAAASNARSASLNALFNGAFCSTANAMLARVGGAWVCQSTLPTALVPAFTGDCTTAGGALATTCAKTNGVAFASSATTDTTNATNISSGTLAALRLPAFGSGDVSFATAGGAGTIASSAVTYAKIQNVTASRLLGNPTGSAAAPSEIPLDTSLAFSGTSLALGANKVWIGRQVFTSSGTYTPTSGTNGINAQCVGGGGGGGGAFATAAGQMAMGVGGGGGAYAAGRFTSSFSGITVTIGAAGTAGVGGGANGGAGGNTTFGALLTANGGAGGVTGGASGTVTAQAGVLGGTGSGGDYQVNGQPAIGITYVTSGFAQGSSGGNSVLGMGGLGATTTTTGVGAAGTGHGSGGGGGGNAASQAAVNGGVGTAGMCIVDEYR